MTPETRPLPLRKNGDGFLPAATWLALAIYAAIVIPYFNYVPIWDGMDYLESYLFAPRHHLALEDFLYSENGHPSFGYYWPFWIGQTLFPDKLIVPQLLNLLMGGLAIVAYGRLAARLFEGRAGSVEIGLLIVAFAVSPVVVAYTINMTMDSGVIAYFLATLGLLYAGRLRWAAVTGLMLIFCKEVGILFYTLIAVVHVARTFDRRRLDRLWPLAIPYGGFIAFLLWRKWEHRAFSPWAASAFVGGTPWQLYIPNPIGNPVARAALGPFVLEFQWIFTGLILTAFVAGLLAARPAGAEGRGILGWLGKFDSALLATGFLILGVLYVVSRTVPFVNQRYFLPLYPLVLLGAFAALIQLRIRPALRVVFLAVMVPVLFCCNFRTLDPVSEEITGTFHFGTHPMLGIATFFSASDTNKDVLVYNLEHTQIAYLIDDAFAQIRPTSQSVIVVDRDAWRLWERIDATTGRRTTAHGPGTIKLVHLKPAEFFALKPRPDSLYLLELPTFHNMENEALLAPFYAVKRRLVFSRFGYRISFVEMTRRPAVTASILPSRRDHVPANPEPRLGTAPL